MFCNEAPYLQEWINCHQSVGVDHFWLYDNCSTDNWKSVLQPYIDHGVVEIIPWQIEFNPANFAPIQVAAFKDGLQCALGKTEWLAFIDIDEFLLPMQELSLKDCLNHHFSNASGVYVTWRNFRTGGHVCS